MVLAVGEGTGVLGHIADRRRPVPGLRFEDRVLQRLTTLSGEEPLSERVAKVNNWPDGRPIDKTGHPRSGSTRALIHGGSYKTGRCIKTENLPQKSTSIEMTVDATHVMVRRT